MNTYQQLPAEAFSALAPFLILYIALLLVLLLGWVVNYIFRGIGVSTLAKKQGLPAPFLAWIPYARTYLCGQLAGDIPFGKRTMRRPGLWLLFLPMACSILLAIVMVLYFVSIFITTLSAAGLPDAQVGSTILSLLVVWIIILTVVSLATSVATSWVMLLVYTNIFKKYCPENTALTHAILSTFVPLYGCIYLFILGTRVNAAPPTSYIPPILPDQE